MPFVVDLLTTSERLPRHPSAEPIRFGLPCAPAAVPRGTPLHLTTEQGCLPTDVEVVERWPDGSARWVVVDGVLPAAATALRLSSAPEAPHASPQMRLDGRSDGWVVDTGAARVTIGRGGVCGVMAVEASGLRRSFQSAGLDVTDTAGATSSMRVTAVRLAAAGAACAVFDVSGEVTVGGVPLHVMAEVRLHAGLSCVTLRVTLRNPRAATHPGGHWDLGDPGSVRFASVFLRLPCEAASPITLDCGDGMRHQGSRLRLLQASSGGERWQHHIHMNAQRKVTLPFRGYAVDVDGVRHEGLRAWPVLASAGLAVAMPRFWQNFPKSLRLDAGTCEVGLFPAVGDEPHELQGGEQKSHDVVIDLGAGVDGDTLSWVHAPRLVHAHPEYYAATGAVPGLVPKSRSTNAGYESLVDSAIDGPDRFDAKREAVDEFGWRHFGDIWGDHEAVFHAGADGPLVSHYNNQYDVIQGFAFQFLRSGDVRWWRHMDELAAHVVDIDVYHTDRDKAAYNHGLFWHTVHYVDADTSTHRTYPKRGSDGGGPSGGHLYTSGLLLHSYLTGARWSRATALELAEYVISCDDGSTTVFKWLSGAPTGHATASGSADYHGPGRAPGNSLNALLDGYRITGDDRFHRKLDEILRRCIHPATDIGQLDLLDAENKWFYMMFAHSLGKYLDWCVEQEALGETYAYARASFLHLMRWAAANERPYLSEPEKLEYPTETWAAQDMRKVDVFLAAARHAETAEARARYMERARFFFDYSVTALEQFPTRGLCRPVVLLLSFGWRWFGEGAATSMTAPTPLPTRSWGSPRAFVAQKPQAIRRAKMLVAGGGLAVLLGAAALAVRLLS